MENSVKCIFKYQMFLKNLFKRSFNSAKNTHFSAHKYMRSVTQTALLYRPQKMVELTREENLKDRVVQTFFDSSNFHIAVSEAEQRLTDVSTFSTPGHSFYQIQLPLQNNQTLRRRMTQFSSSNIRVGRLLQLMDYIAANVAYRYCSPGSDKDLDMNDLSFIAVTACIDQIQFYYPISNEADCLLSGYVSYVGRSSMEVHIDVLQKIEGEERLACSANFVMVARHKQSGKSYQVPALSLAKENQKFRIITELGQERQFSRKEETKRGLQMAPPTYEQSVSIHKLIKTMKSGVDNYRPISSTTIKNTMLMHIEDKNLSGKIFGGMILRCGYEVGWLCASKFLQAALPMATQIDQVQFLAPVEVGSYIQLTANVGYSTDKFLHIIVKCHNSTLGGKRLLTNVLHITFQHPEKGSVARVYPQSLSESYLYIESLRRIQKLSHSSDN